MVVKNHNDRHVKMNVKYRLPKTSKSGQKIVIGCNYHTTWQSDPRMRFILWDIKGDKVLLRTRNTKKEFWTDGSSLIFINSMHNNSKARTLTKKV